MISDILPDGESREMFVYCRPAVVQPNANRWQKARGLRQTGINVRPQSDQIQEMREMRDFRQRESRFFFNPLIHRCSGIHNRVNGEKQTSVHYENRICYALDIWLEFHWTDQSRIQLPAALNHHHLRLQSRETISLYNSLDLVTCRFLQTSQILHTEGYAG